ncbi:EAL domain-containing protein [Yoonia sp. SS1-5]|uniref:Bifunctional diguanylate cyclase/phosphodiesterase n=1 Tax=Yoonia rhodophyticola TaxID=3137370 RepID=A0AAN0NJS8_9RHOB
MTGWVRKLNPRYWSIRGLVIAIPVLGGLSVTLLLFFGMQLADRHLQHLENDVKASLTYQHTALKLPILVKQIHADLYQLAALREGGAPQFEISRTKAAIQRDFRRIQILRLGLDPRMRMLDVDKRLDALAEIVTQAAGANMADAIAVSQNYDSHLNAAAATFSAMAAQTRLLVFEDMDTMRADTTRLVQAFFVGLALLAAIMCLVALSVARNISTPILKLAHNVEALDKGALDIKIPGTGRTDEIGKVARAVSRLQGSQRRTGQLEQERDDLNRTLEQKVAARTSELAVERERLANAQALAEQTRQEMTAQLRQEFGQVINAASAGDFTQRVHTEFSDENLQALANDINHFVDRVDGSVAAVGQAMHDMAEGRWDAGADHAFTGSFAEIMDQIHDTGTQISQQSGQLTHIALHDALTSLPNRRFLEERLADYNKLLAVTELPLGVLHIDLDRFKEINDRLGHAAGDAVLKQAAQILDELAQNDDFVARVGGDEFMMLCPMMDDSGQERDRIIALGEEIVAKLSEPVHFEDELAFFGASVGIAFSQPDTTDLATLVVDADIALYQAKEDGRNQAAVFSTEIAAAIAGKRTMRDDLLAALEHGELEPYFQPKYDARSLQLKGVEALVRWNHPQRGLLTPDKFLPAAEDMNVVSVIDHQILWRSVEIISELNAAHGFHIPELSVNISQSRLYDPELLRSVDGLSPPFALSFELLESIYFDDGDDRFYWMLDLLRERGIGIQIDDFGSGRASISALININPDRLKIDRSLVRPLTEKAGSSQLIKGIVDIARSMNIGVTAEGVETQKHANLLRDLGCDMLQGYAFAKPMPADALKEFCLKAAS